MKRTSTIGRVLISGLMLLSGMTVLATPSTDDNKTGDNVTILVPINRNTSHPILRKPGLSVMLECRVSAGIFTISVPDDLVFDMVELEQQTAPYGYWSGSSSMDNDFEINFDGTVGDYKLTLSGSDSSYVGYFILE